MARRLMVYLGAAVILLASVALMGGSAGDGYLWYHDRDPIYIYGDTGFTAANGVIGGRGTADDPYVIEGWQIPASYPYTDYGIYIDHTSRHFVIRNCSVEGARDAAIRFNTVENGRIEQCLLVGNGSGIELENSRYNVITGNMIRNNLYGIAMLFGAMNNITYANSFLDNGMGGLDREHANLWSMDGVGNYWSDYAGADADGDGIGDSPYRGVADLAPQMASDIQWLPVGVAMGPIAVSAASASDSSFVITSTTPIALAATDRGSGVAAIYFRLDEGDWTAYYGPFVITGQDGPRRIDYYAVDRLGNEGPTHTRFVFLNNVPPMPALRFDGPTFVDASGRWINARTRISLDILGGASSIDLWTCYQIDEGEWIRYSGPFGITGADGPHVISYYVEDAYGNHSEILSATVILDNAPPVLEGEDQSLPSTGQPCCPGEEGMTEEVGASTPPPSEPASVVTANAEPSKPEVGVEPETEVKPDPRVVVIVGGDSQPEADTMPVSEPTPAETDVQTTGQTVEAETVDDVQTASHQTEADG